jgi:hypothetical protein
MSETQKRLDSLKSDKCEGWSSDVEVGVGVRHWGFVSIDWNEEKGEPESEGHFKEHARDDHRRRTYWVLDFHAEPGCSRSTNPFNDTTRRLNEAGAFKTRMAVGPLE